MNNTMDEEESVNLKTNVTSIDITIDNSVQKLYSTSKSRLMISTIASILSLLSIAYTLFKVTQKYISFYQPVDQLPVIPESYFAICMIVANQARDLPEFFIHHYYNIGVRKFYIMDDGSSPPLSEYKDYGIPREALKFMYFTPDQSGRSMQRIVYDVCASNFGHKHTWMGFIDTDEFIEMTSNETLYSFLQSFEGQPNVGAVAMSWKAHTSSGHLTRQPSVRKAFTSCLTLNDSYSYQVKSIVRMTNYNHSNGAHMFALNSSKITVGEMGDLVPLCYRCHARNMSSWDRIALHHYVVKSKEEYGEKLARGNGMHVPGRDWSLWDRMLRKKQEPCTSMANYDL